nr:hypothetical protein [Tanacetum cinerariifolium]
QTHGSGISILLAVGTPFTGSGNLYCQWELSPSKQHSISLELALQQCQEQMKNDTVCKQNGSTVFLKEREQCFEVQDLKVQLIPKPSILGNLTPFSDFLERKRFKKTKSVIKTNMSEGLSKPATTQVLPPSARQVVSNTNVIKPGMYQINTRTTQTRAPQAIKVCQSFPLSLSLSNNSTKQDTQPTTNIQPTTELITLTTNVNAKENNYNQAADAHIDEYEFYNIFGTLVCEEGESSSLNVDNLNMHTFYQHHQSEHRWTKDHPLEQVCGNPSKPVQTRSQLATYLKMCMFALIVSIAKRNNIKEAIIDSTWIEVMQDGFHQFDILKVQELVDKPFGKKVIKLKWLWKNK